MSSKPLKKHHLFFHLRNAHGLAFGLSSQEACVGAISSAQKSNERIDIRMDAPARTCLPRQNVFWGVMLGGLGVGGRAAQAKYAPQNQAWRAERPSAAWVDTLPKPNMPVEIILGVLRSRSPPGRARRPGGPCNMGVRLGALGAHSLKLPQPSTSTG